MFSYYCQMFFRKIGYLFVFTVLSSSLLFYNTADAQDDSGDLSEVMKASILRSVEAAGELHFAYLSDQFDKLSRGQSSIFGRANAIADATKRIELQSFASKKANEFAIFAKDARNNKLS